MHRLEDLRKDWQASSEPLVQECMAGIAARVTAMLANPAERPPAEYDSEVGLLVNLAVREWAERRLLPHCLEWLQQKKHWPNREAAGTFAVSELAAALQQMPAFQSRLPAPEPRVPLRSWALAAGIGALVGMVPGALLSWALTERREAGLAIGGIAGAMGLVTAVGLIAESPAVRTALTYALTLSTAGTLLGGVRAYWRQESTTGWLRGGFGLLAAWFVVILARPRLDAPAADSILKQLQHELRGHLRHVADLVLAWCWAHPDRQPRARAPVSPDEVESLTGSVNRCLGNLYARIASSNGEAAGLQDAVEELLQRCEDAGFEWKLVPAGTPFDESMKKDFETFTRIEPGQPVRTRRPALRLNDRLIQKGELQRE